MKQKVVSLPRVLVLFIVLLVTTSLLSSCSDDESKGSANFFKLGEVKKSLNKALVFYDNDPAINAETEESYYRNELILYSKGLKTVEEDDGEIELEGEGDAIVLELVSSSQNLEVGTYEWTGTEENPAAFDIWDASTYLSFNTTTQNGESWNFTDATLVVSKEGDTYTITLSGVIAADLNHDEMVEAVTVNASYKGKVERFSEE